MNDNCFRRCALALLPCAMVMAAVAQPGDDPAKPALIKPARDLKPARASEPHATPEPVLVSRTEKLKLLDGGSLNGKFMGIESGLVRWRHPSADVDIPFKAGDVDSLVIARRPLPAGHRLHASGVELVNGDWLLGDCVEMSP